MWGHPLATIRRSLLDRGAPPQALEDWLGEAQREVDAEFRRLGVRDALAGGALAAGAAVAFAAYSRQPIVVTAVAGAIVAVGLAGALLFARGVARLIGGA
ncbi:MAG: hypothetical protein M9894_17975 [Planctomycetes bacterium]|nr:hypothetical protein [Planctomycetota bacterium]